MSEEKCPVDHSTREAWIKQNEKSKAATAQTPDACPVDHSNRSTWLKKISSAPEAIEVPAAAPGSETCSSDKLSNKLEDSIASSSSSNLSKEREISSIPRTNSESNWIYPSQKQFFDAMKRKNWNPDEDDMHTVVPIHNAVNEKAWSHIIMWERAYYEDAMKQCGGIKLTSFKGDSKKLTPRAWLNSTFFGYEKPFDRHDWTVDRCGVEVPYVIDFYGGNGPGASFFLDVRPKINSWEGFKLRMGRAMGLC
ncbi:holocytochrome-c1 synthase [[Candida] railenensis]|uniref:Holocytochrome c-type synthase n=1 Tax=[Candida] railenensis TaxID=45579 RepID=A0A9P0QVD1_9ASCO|nr:holocytochrome-c1 synthase [[Candida] railenensis]